MQQDEELETYLGEFRPREVRPLTLPARATRPWSKTLAAAAVLLVCAGIATRYAQKPDMENAMAPRAAVETDQPADAPRPNLFALTRLALEDDQEFQMAQTRLLSSFFPTHHNL